MPLRIRNGIKELHVHPVQQSKGSRYQKLMQAHHYLGSLPKIGETLWYVANYHRAWVVLLSFSAVLTGLCHGHPRSAPRPRAAPPVARGSGYRRGGYPVRHVRLQGHLDWAERRRASGSAAAMKPDATSCRANTSCVMSSSASIPRRSTAPCNAGMQPLARPTKVLPSTARGCATPSTTKGSKPTSWV